MQKQGEKQSREKAWAGGTWSLGVKSLEVWAEQQGGEAGGQQAGCPGLAVILTAGTKPHFYSIHIRATVLSAHTQRLHFPQQAREWVLGWTRLIDEN